MRISPYFSSLLCFCLGAALSANIDTSYPWLDASNISRSLESITSKNLSHIESSLKLNWRINSLTTEDQAGDTIYIDQKDTIGYKCSPLSPIITGFHENAGTWGKLIHFLSLRDQDGSTSARTFPRLAACLLITPFTPATPPLDPSFEIKIRDIVSTIASVKETLTGTVPECELELFGEIFDFMTRMGFGDLECFAAKLGIVSVLQNWLEDISTARGLLKLYSCPRDIVSSASAIKVVQFMRSFDSGSAEANQALLLQAVKDDKVPLVEYLIEGLDVNALDVLNGPPSSRILLRNVTSWAMAKMLFDRGLRKDRSNLSIAIEGDLLEVVKFLHSHDVWYSSPDAEVVQSLMHGSERVFSYYISELNYRLEPSSNDVTECISLGRPRCLRLLFSLKPSLVAPDLVGQIVFSNNVEVIEEVFSALITAFRNGDPGASHEDISGYSRDILHKMAFLFDMAVDVLDWIKRQCDRYAVGFPEPTYDAVKAALLHDAPGPILWYWRTFRRPIAGLQQIIQDLSARGTFKAKYETYILAAEHGVPLRLSQDSFSQALRDQSLDAIKFFVDNYIGGAFQPGKDFICACLASHRLDLLEWVSSADRSRINVRFCPNWSLSEEYLPVYRFAYENFQWLPSKDMIDRSIDQRQFGILAWAFHAVGETIYPSEHRIRNFIVNGDSLMLRLIHTLKPIDFFKFQDALKVAVKSGKLDAGRWFPDKDLPSLRTCILS